MNTYIKCLFDHDSVPEIQAVRIAVNAVYPPYLAAVSRSSGGFHEECMVDLGHSLGKIKMDDTGDELVVQKRSLVCKGYRVLVKGCKVEFSRGTDPDGLPSAIDVRGLKGKDKNTYFFRLDTSQCANNRLLTRPTCTWQEEFHS